MPKKSISLFETNDQIFHNSHDARTRKKSQRVIKELFSNFTSRDIAEQLNLTPRQAIGIKTRVLRGKLYSRDLNDLLEEAIDNLRDNPRIGDDPIQGDNGEWYYKNSSTLKKDYPKHVIASYKNMSYQGALNWWKGVTGGADYFVILRDTSQKGKNVFWVADIDPGRLRKGGEKSKKINNYRTHRAKMLQDDYLKTIGKGK